ncbi:Hypothetical protein, putative [Bodo saltans]|uniref:SURP motif domain-containing protein n=1 Tax=Bodo saltans TaxID=75058 RepID=A0A0S4ITK9_BODSA|nr:Hypothetical protein, putative [Bodo saltans]|eukprot:CUF74613.1 Hypothetical protein, putative [Bodo saltans]
MNTEAALGFYGSTPSTLASAPNEGTYNASKWFAAQHQAKLPSAGCKLSTVVTDSDVSRWEASLDTEAANLLAHNEDVAAHVIPDLANAVVSQETAADVSRLCIIPPFVPSSVAARSNAKQLAHRSKWLPYRQKVPVYQQRSAIVASVRDARVVTVVGGPHSGKSTQVPQLLAETDMFKRKRIVVATATPMSAVLLAKRLREEKGDSAPSIAHCVALSTSDCTQASLIVVCTYDVLFRSLLADARMQDVGCIVLDDLHVHHTLYMDLCLTALRDLLSHATANKDIRLVINCRDDVVESSLLQFLQPLVSAGQKFDRHVVPDSMTNSSAVMYLDDAAQWLQKSDAAKGNASLVRDPAAELGDVANNVQVLARVLDSDTAGDIIKTNVKGLENYWLPLLREIAFTYDVAESKNNAEATTKAKNAVKKKNAGDIIKTNAKGLENYWLPLLREIAFTYDVAESKNNAEATTKAKNAVMIVLPSSEMCSVVEEDLRKHHNTTVESSPPFHVVTFVTQLTPAAMEAAASQVSAALLNSSQRVVLLTTPQEIVNTTLIPFKNIGCLIDTCRQDRIAYDSSVEADRWTIGETISKAALRDHRLLLHSNPTHTMSIQLLSRQALHSQRTKQTNPHPLATATLDALLAAITFVYLRTKHQQQSGSGLGPRLVKHFLSTCWDANPNQLRGDAWQKNTQQAESWLQHLGALDAKFALTGLGVGSLVIGLPWQVSRLLLFGSLFAPTAVIHIALLGATWLAGDIFDSKDESSAQDAKKFFLSSNSGESIGVPINAFSMWRTVVKTPAEEDEFLATAHLSKSRLLEVQALHLELLNRLRQSGLSTMDAPTIEMVDKVLTLQSDSAAAPHDAALRFCATGAVHPNVAFHSKSGALGVARLMDTAVPSLLPTVVVPPRSGLVTAAPVQIAVTKIVAPTGSHMELTTCGSMSLPAAVVCCGVGVRQPLTPPTRTRGWMSALTNTWRQTNAARHLPPPPQISARTVPLKFHNPTRVAPVALELDGAINVLTSATTAALLSKIRDFSKRKLATMISLKESKAVAEATSSRNTLEEILQWLDQRQATQEDFLRDRREHMGVEQNAGDLPLPYLTFAEAYERPVAIRVVAAQAFTASSAASTGAAGPAAVTGEVAVATALTFTGAIPPDQATQALIRRTAETIGKNPNRDGEANFMQRDNFAFLRQDHQYHEYYLHILKKEAPHLDWLGDDLVELENWLQDLERQIEKDAESTWASNRTLETCLCPTSHSLRRMSDQLLSEW